jgi:hypothetical protein
MESVQPGSSVSQPVYKSDTKKSKYSLSTIWKIQTTVQHANRKNFFATFYLCTYFEQK